MAVTRLAAGLMGISFSHLDWRVVLAAGFARSESRSAGRSPGGCALSGGSSLFLL